MGPAGSLSGDARTFSHGAPHHDTTHRDSRERFHSDPDRYRFPGKYEAHEASCDGTLKVWDLETGAVTHTLKGHLQPVIALAATRDGHRAVSGAADKTIRVWDLDRGGVEACFHADGEVVCCASLDTGAAIVAGDAYGRVYHLVLEDLKFAAR